MNERVCIFIVPDATDEFIKQLEPHLKNLSDKINVQFLVMNKEFKTIDKKELIRILE